MSGTVSDDLGTSGVGPLCLIQSKVNAPIYQDVLEHFMLPSADKLYGDVGFNEIQMADISVLTIYFYTGLT